VARNKDGLEIDLSDELSTTTYLGGVYSQNFSSRGSYSSSAFTARGGGVYEEIAEFVFTTPLGDVYSGLGFSSARINYFFWESSGEYNSLPVVGSQRISGILGALQSSDPDSDYSEVILTGSATLGPSRAVKQ
jgi:hypothetical protein